MPGDEIQGYRPWLESVLGVPAVEGNRVEVLRNGDQIFPAMLDAISEATSTVDLATFVFDGSVGVRFAETLAAKAAEGVRVRVLLDSLGSRHIDRSAIEDLRAAGGEVEWFRPMGRPRIWETFHRCHRKIMVCDGRVGFTGGVGLADEWRGDARDPSEWRDTHFRILGPAVDGLRGAFLNNWAETGRQLFDVRDSFVAQEPAGSSVLQVVRTGARTGWGSMLTLMRAFIGLARKRLRITTAYFFPDRRGLELICSAAQRGISVELLVNGPNYDKRISRLASESLFEGLLRAGVRIWTYQPTMLHTKVMTVDGKLATVGSSNFNVRSLTLDEELNLVLFDRDLVRVLDDHFEDDLDHATEVDLDVWSERNRSRQVLEAAPRLLSRHL